MNDWELRQMVVEQLHYVRQDAGQDQPAGDDLDLTSLELVRLLVNLEEQLDVELDYAAIMNGRLDTIDDIVALMRRSLTVAATVAAE